MLENCVREDAWATKAYVQFLSLPTVIVRAMQLVAMSTQRQR